MYRIESQQQDPKSRTHTRKRPLHWFIVLISYLFIFLLILESLAFILLGTWHLSIPRLENVRTFSGSLYRRELAFGILLVVVGALGIFISILGIIATIMLRKSILSTYAACLWILIILGIVVGIIGIIFASQVNGFMHDDRTTNPNLIEKNYYEERYLLGMNGALSIFMSLTMIVGSIVICCLINDANYYWK